MIHPCRSVVPSVHPSVRVADSAHVIGDVALAAAASVWFGSVVRGDFRNDYLAAARKG